MTEPPVAQPPSTPPTAVGPRAALSIRITGAVQGVGFRPFVYGLATDHGLAGEVRNTGEGVEVEVEGRRDDLEQFLRRLVDDAPPLALVETVSSQPSEPRGRSGFVITPSSPGARIDTLVTADAATCQDCLSEVFDPADRRYRYPFTNCTNCGPRFTITVSVPYDRPNTTMAGFIMCPACEAEYRDPSHRRFHAQPNACPVCGPRLSFFTGSAGEAAAHGPVTAPVVGGAGAGADGDPDDTDRDRRAVDRAVEVLRRGGTLAVKGLGGYHLACDATDADAVTRLRARKHRDEKPFAVMMADIAQVDNYCVVSGEETALLSSPRRPIVLLERRPGGPTLADDVAPGVTTYGVFLPYTPLHHLLLREFGRPLVMTSGNISDEPIAYRDDEARSRLETLADAFLTHDRPIHMRTDDSVARVFRGRPYPLRRARGYAPLPVGFSGSDREILAVGAHLKNTFCLTRGDRAFLSHHIGDLENLETLRSLEEGVAHFAGLFDLRPQVVVHDLHPDYLSTRFARSYALTAGLPLLAVQHHEAHVASVLAETGYDGQVVGIAFDGAGLGDDGTIWGGEFFVGRAGSLVRVAHVDVQPLPGGDAAVREPWRLAAVQVAAVIGPSGPASDGHRSPVGDDAAGGVRPDDLYLEPVARRLALLPEGGRFADYPWPLIVRAARRGVNTPSTSSVGRLFDTVAALLGLRHKVAYEGQAAILLEAAARRFYATRPLPTPTETAPWAIMRDIDPTGDSAGAEPPDRRAPLAIPVGPFVEAVLDDLDAGRPPDEIAARFHHTLAAVTADVALWAADRHGAAAAVLGGGVFQNLLLLELLHQRLEAGGLQVLVHRSVPTNDGGLCLGQAETAAAWIRTDRLHAQSARLS